MCLILEIGFCVAGVILIAPTMFGVHDIEQGSRGALNVIGGHVVSIISKTLIFY